MKIEENPPQSNDISPGLFAKDEPILNSNTGTASRN